jgi:hypothetical protein|tara:strand:- start:279 stop:401 length:123 start_codon:yes stop_codon:yes gene_type:complete
LLFQLLVKSLASFLLKPFAVSSDIAHDFLLVMVMVMVMVK